jgi:hypothetical protein
LAVVAHDAGVISRGSFKDYSRLGCGDFVRPVDLFAKHYLVAVSRHLLFRRCLLLKHNEAARKVSRKEKRMSNAIDFTKPVRTKDGRAVRILCTDGPSINYPVIGIIHGDRDVSTWAFAGFFSSEKDEENPLNLENIPPPPREWWVNVYEHGDKAHRYTGSLLDSPAQACKELHFMTHKRIACVKITEGEGLE